MATNSIQSQINNIVRNLEKVSKKFDKKGQQRVLKKGAKVVEVAIKAAMPRSSEIHHRYSTAKLDKSKRAAKGSGQIEASYTPGNAERSIQTMLFSKSPAVFVGPRIAKRNKKGLFSGRKVDGHYMHMIENGTVHYQGRHPIARGWESSKGAAFIAIQSEGKKMMKELNGQMTIL